MENKIKTTLARCSQCNGAFICVPGEMASKANSRRSVIIGGNRRFIKSPKALDVERYWHMLCPRLFDLLSGDLTAHIWLYYKTKRPDLDESLVLDLLQNRLYRNDRQVKEKHVYHRIDKDDPRSEVIVTPLAGCTAGPDGGCLLTKRDNRGKGAGVVKE